MPKRNSFAFLVHPTSLNSIDTILGFNFTKSRIISQIFIKEIIKNVPPFVFLKFDSIRSNTGIETSGVAILCPLFPEQFATLDSNLVREKIVAGCKLAEKKGASVVGLAGFTSIFSNQGEDLRNRVKISMTTGNTYTSVLVVDKMLEACELIHKKVQTATLAVVGAYGDIGSACIRFLAPFVRKVILVGRNQDKLLNFVDTINSAMREKLILMTDPETAVSEADLVLTATSSISTLLTPSVFKPGSIVCDVSLPPNIGRNVLAQRGDILVFEGGYASLPNFNIIANKKFRRFFPFGAIFGCLAETIILSMEGINESFSIGRGNITLSKMDAIRSLAKKHGFKSGPFFCGDKILDDARIARVRSIQ